MGRLRLYSCAGKIAHFSSTHKFLILITSIICIQMVATDRLYLEKKEENKTLFQ